jgi:hypothetical protein
MQKHTPTPWKVKRWTGLGQKGIGIVAERDLAIADITMQLDDKEMANAAFIVRAVNMHQELVTALKRAHRLLCNNDIIMTGNHELITQAEGK